MRILAVAMLLLAGARSEAQLPSIEKTMTLGTLEFTSRVDLVDDAKILKTIVRIRNQGRDTVQIFTPTPSCTVMLVIYAQFFGGGDAPIYDGRRKERVCTSEMRRWTLTPDSSVTFVDTDSVAVVRKRTSPEALYYFSAFLYVGRMGRLELPTGGSRIP